eukprot:g23718.t2
MIYCNVVSICLHLRDRHRTPDMGMDVNQVAGKHVLQVRSRSEACSLALLVTTKLAICDTKSCRFTSGVEVSWACFDATSSATYFSTSSNLGVRVEAQRLSRPNLKFPLPQDLEDQIEMDWAGLGVATWIDLVAV